MSATPEEVTKNGILNFMAFSFNTCTVAKITSVTNFAQKGTITVKPVLNYKYQDGTIGHMPSLLEVPTVFPSGGGGMLSFPLAVGDTVMLLFSQRSLDEWKVSDGSEETYTPLSSRVASLSDAIAVPGIFPTIRDMADRPNGSEVELKMAGSSVKMFSNGDVIVAAAKDLKATAAGRCDFNIEGTFKVTANKIELNSSGVVDINGSVINLN